MIRGVEHVGLVEQDGVDYFNSFGLLLGLVVHDHIVHDVQNVWFD